MHPKKVGKFAQKNTNTHDKNRFDKKRKTFALIMSFLY